MFTRIPSFAAALLISCAAAAQLHAQSQIAFSQRIHPSAEDLQSAPLFFDIDFGAAVAISGRTALAGMPKHSGSGRVGVFTRNNEQWVRTATLLPSSANDQLFGGDLDLDGNTAVIDASGTAYLFEKHGSQWRQGARVVSAQSDLTIASAIAHERGFVAHGVVALSAGGEVLPGTVYVYRYDRHSRLRRLATLRASDSHTGDFFGASVALQGGVLVVGAPETNGSPGAAYVFVRNGNRWIERQKLIGSAVPNNAQFGSAVAVHKRLVVVSSPFFDLPGDNTTVPEGDATAFRLRHRTWFESQRLNEAAQYFALFGSRIALTQRLAAFSTPFNEAIIRSEGAVTLFDRAGSTLSNPRQIFRTATGNGDIVAGLDLSGRRLIIGVLNSSVFQPSVIGSAEILELANAQGADMNDVDDSGTPDEP